VQPQHVVDRGQQHSDIQIPVEPGHQFAVNAANRGGVRVVAAGESGAGWAESRIC